MLSPRDAALVESYAEECEDRAGAASIEGAEINNRRSVEAHRTDDRTANLVASQQSFAKSSRITSPSEGEGHTFESCQVRHYTRARYRDLQAAFPRCRVATLIANPKNPHEGGRRP
jgi:hypothetical protein